MSDFSPLPDSLPRFSSDPLPASCAAAVCAGAARHATAAVCCAVIAGCGGGGDSASSAVSPSPPAPAPAPAAEPTDKATAISYQYQRVAEVRSAADALVDGDERALAALNAQRYADWDAYWENEYPVLVDRFEQAAANLHRSEDFVQRLVYGIDPAVAGGSQPKVVPLPIVLLAAVVITRIAVAERERLAGLQRPSTRSEDEEVLTALQGYYEQQGLSGVAARTRAIADQAQIKTLKGLKIGIEHGKVFVFNTGLKPQLGQLLPPSVKTVVKVDKIRRKVGEIKDNIEVLMTPKSCRTDPQSPTRFLRAGAAGYAEPAGAQGEIREVGPYGESRELPALTTKATLACGVYFCSTDGDDCGSLPEGDWEATIFLPEHLRDIDLDVPAEGGAPVSIDGEPVAAGDIEDPPPLAQCSSVQNAGGDRGDRRTVPLGASSGSFAFGFEMFRIRDRMKIYHDGSVLYDTGCVSGSASRMVPYSGLARFVTVEVLPNCSGNTSGTAWNYTLSCPSQ